jgi:hypothetical protein
MIEGATVRSATARARQRAGPALTANVRCLMHGYGLPPWGNLHRKTPFSLSYGFQRGTPIHRYHLHRFLSAHRDLITGGLLEAQRSGYTSYTNSLAAVAAPMGIALADPTAAELDVRDPGYPVLTAICCRTSR